jgi:putative transposase
MVVEHPRAGYQMLTDKIRFEGEIVNHKRVHRVYREEGLQLPRRRKKRMRSVRREPLQTPRQLNECWSMDFVHDMLADQRRFRTFTLLDNFSRECLALDVATSIPGARVVRVLDRVAQQRGYPETIVCDNGPEFRGRDMDRWAAKHGARLHFIDPGKPMQNAFVESFHDKFRAESLNATWFLDLADARTKIEAWREEYNERRPHRSIGRIPPAVFARRSTLLQSPPAPSGPSSRTTSAEVQSVHLQPGQ